MYDGWSESVAFVPKVFKKKVSGVSTNRNSEILHELAILCVFQKYLCVPQNDYFDHLSIFIRN